MSGSILFATAANIVVAIATYIYYGWNAVGGADGARNTARLSSVFFALALASHFHSRFGRDYVPLIKAFVAAHVVHYATVIAFHAILGKLATPMFWGIDSTGATLLAATALTITKMPRTHLGADLRCLARVHTRVHQRSRQTHAALRAVRRPARDCDARAPCECIPQLEDLRVFRIRLKEDRGQLSLSPVFWFLFPA